jgi:hypothetical protein
MLENMMMPREYGYKSQSYAAEQIDDDVMDALPPPQQDKYMENKIAPQIEEQMKDITFDNEDDKLKSYKQAVSNKTAKEWGTKHANKLQPYDIKYKDNEYYKSNYVSRLQDIMTQDTMKTRGGTKTNTIESKEKAKDLLKAMGIKPAIKIAVPEYIPPAAQPEVAPPATPPRPNRQAQVVKSPAPAPPKPAPAPPPPKPTPPPPPPPPKAAPPPPPPPKEGKGPPPPPPPPTDNAIQGPEKAKASREKMLSELIDKVENDDPDERASKKEASSKTQGTKDGKSLTKIKKQWVNYVGYRDNYEKNLKAVMGSDSTTKDDRTKAEELLRTLDDQYKLDASEDMPNPTTTTKLKINTPRFTANEAYKKEYKKRGNKLLKKIKESAILDDEDKKNIKLIEEYYKLFDS